MIDFRGRPDDELLLELLVAAVRDPGDLRREPLDVLGLAHQQALGNEQRKVRVDVAGRLEPAVERLLDQLPDGVAVRPDHHAALDGRVVGQLRAPDDVEVPAREVLRLRRDLGDERLGFFCRPCLVRRSVLPPSIASFATSCRRVRSTRGSLRLAFPQLSASSVHRRGPGSRRGSARRGSPRGAAPRARSGGRPSARLAVRQSSASSDATCASARPAPATPARARASARDSPSRVAEQPDVLPHQCVTAAIASPRIAPRVGRLPDGAVTSVDVRRRTAAFVPAWRIRRARRTPALRAASCWRGGWRRGRRCRRPRRPRTAPASIVRAVQIGVDAAHHVVRGGADRDAIAREVEPRAPAHRRR